MSPIRILLLGAAGRDFHVFNTLYKHRHDARVVAFTATQIPNIAQRTYPPSLSGPLYPQGIPIVAEAEVDTLVARLHVDHAVFCYSDVPLTHIARLRARITALGATFATFDVDASMLPCRLPVIAVTATRTGCGKSPTTRALVSMLRDAGHKPIVVRHPMPYGTLAKQAVQRFATMDDLVRHECTLEEREEYEHHIQNRAIVYAGADYAAIFDAAAREGDVLLWDGGNNDTPFVRPNLWICVADAHRPNHEVEYFPGTINFARAHVILINKVNTAPAQKVAVIEANARRINPRATVIHTRSIISVADPTRIRGKRVLAVEDGPTCTHGGMTTGAACIAAQQWGGTLVDPRPALVGSLRQTFAQYPDIGTLLPAMGYSPAQLNDLEATIARVTCDAVLVGTPIDLESRIRILQPVVRVMYAMEEVEKGRLEPLVMGVVRRSKL